MPDREPLLDRVRRQLAGEEAPPVTRAGPGGEVLDLDELVAKLGTQLGPFHQPPNMYVPYHVRVDLLRRTFAGVELGGWDQRVLSWLANADGDTVVALAGMVHRAMTDAAERG